MVTVTRDPRAALVAWRRSVPYTQTDVGPLFGVSKQAISNWEQGRARVPARVQRLLRREGWLVPRYAVWTAEHDAWLDAHREAFPVPELAVRISAAFGIPRTAPAIRDRLRRRGQDSQQGGELLTRAQIAWLCGVSASTVRAWLRCGWLQAPAWALRERRGQWAVPASVLARFAQEHAVQLDPARMPPSPYRAQVAACWQRERWLDVRAAARYAGVSRATLCRWCQAGRLPAVRQNRRAGAVWMVRARDLAAFLRERAA